MFIKRALLAAMPLIACVGFSQDTLNLQFRPKADQVRKYSVKMQIEVSGFEVMVNMTAQSKILKIEDNGDVTTEGKTLKGVLNMNGEEQDIPQTPATVSTRSSKGVLVKAEANPGSNPLSQMGGIVRTLLLPEGDAKAGLKWSKKVKKDEKLGLPDAEISYELVGKDKVGDIEVAKIKFEYKDNDAKGASTGEILIRLSDGATYSVTSKFTNLSPSPQAPAGNGTMEMKLVEG